MKHRLSVFNNARDNVPKPVTYSWPEFVSELLPHTFRPGTCDDNGAKLACEAFSPAHYLQGATRSNDNVCGLSLYVADLDHITDEQVELFVQAATARGWAFVLYTTWRHRSDPNRLRAVFPLSRDVTPDEWPLFWQLMGDALGNIADPARKDLSGIYFGAFAPDTPDDRAAAFDHVFEGKPIDVDEVIGTLPPVTPPTTPKPAEPNPQTETVSRAQLDRFATALKRKHDDRQQGHGETIKKIVDGEAFAEPGNVDNTIYRIARVLAERWPDASSRSIAEHFHQSLDLMAKRHPTYAMNVGQVAYKIGRAQCQIVDQRRQVEADFLETSRQRIRDAFGTDRDTPYTSDEVKKLGANPRWIVQKGKSYYCLVDNTYRGPYTTDEAQNAAIRDLAPASTAGIELFTINAQGSHKPKALPTLIRKYGFIAADVAVSLSAQRSYFDEKARTIVEAPCPLRDIKPAYHGEIDAWLEALAGPEKVTFLKAWIANVTKLEVPCTALFLTGHKHTGKTLLPEGLSRLWTLLGYPTPLEDVLGTSFNDAQIRCPLVFADERLPTDHRGRVLNAELRHYIQSRRRPLRRKFLSNADMIGAVRLVISANNEEILATNENLSNQDIGAIVDRYLHIKCRVDAFAYLQQVEHSKWVESGAIAEHALWLRDNFDWKPNGRFLVHSEDNELHSRLISSSGIRSAVLQFCVGYLLDPGKLDNHASGQYWIRTFKGRLCVNTQALVKCWPLYVSNEHCPSTGRISSAIGALATDERVRLHMPGGKRPNYRVIRREHLIAWAIEKGFATDDEIDEALDEDTEARSKDLAPN